MFSEEEPEREIIPESSRDPGLPSAVNLPLLAEDVTFDISIKRAAPEERTAALEEKRAGLTEQAKATGEKRFRRTVILFALLAVLSLCLYEVFFASVDEERRQFAEKVAFVIVAFAVGNALPSLIKEDGEGKEK